MVPVLQKIVGLSVAALLIGLWASESLVVLWNETRIGLAVAVVVVIAAACSTYFAARQRVARPQKIKTNRQ